jgi:hypothetical protein
MYCPITMMLVWLFAIAFLLFALRFRETYVDPEQPVNRPTLMGDKIGPEWQSKIDAEAPIGGDDMDYFKVLQAFYDKVYEPAKTKPKDTDLEAFLKTPDAQVAGVDPNALRKIIVNGFRLELTSTAAAREQAQVKTTGALAGFKGAELQPTQGRDQVRTRTEQIYTPADSRKGDLPEGLYEPTKQSYPSKEGLSFLDNLTSSWGSGRFYSVCDPLLDEMCAKNVL